MPRMKNVVLTSGEKVAIGIKIDKIIWSRFKRACAVKGTTATELVEELMSEFTKKYDAVLKKLED